MLASSLGVTGITVQGEDSYNNAAGEGVYLV
jgi:hypothetical protein